MCPIIPKLLASRPLFFGEAVSQDPFREGTSCYAPNEISKRLDVVDSGVIMILEQVLRQVTTI